MHYEPDHIRNDHGKPQTVAVALLPTSSYQHKGDVGCPPVWAQPMWTVDCHCFRFSKGTCRLETTVQGKQQLQHLQQGLQVHAQWGVGGGVEVLHEGVF